MKHPADGLSVNELRAENARLRAANARYDRQTGWIMSAITIVALFLPAIVYLIAWGWPL